MLLCISYVADNNEETKQAAETLLRWKSAVKAQLGLVSRKSLTNA